MASTNQSPQYKAAEAKFLQAQTDEEKLLYLQEMIRECPKHKSSEKMLAMLKTRLKKLKEKLIIQKKSRKSKQGIKKQALQACLIGLTNTGKSTILSKITNAQPKIAPYPYTTTNVNIGTLDFEGVKIQILDLPAIESEYFNQGIINITDLLLIVITNLKDLTKITPFLQLATKNRLIIYNKIDNLSQQEKRKLLAKLKSKKLNFILLEKNFEELKQKIFTQFNIIRIYTKQPHQPPSSEPLVLPVNSTVEQVAAKISKQLLNNLKETRITGPSSKFPNQKVGIKHILKDKDIVEFHSR